MKKNVLTTVLAAGCACMMMFSANAADLTADEVLANYFEASKEVKSAAADVTMDAAIAVGVQDEGMTLDMNGHADMSMVFSLDPIQYEVDANMSGSLMGQGGEIGMTMYMVDEDGSLVTYMGIEGTGITEGDQRQWVKQAIPEADTSQLTDMMSTLTQVDMSDAPITYELADEMKDVNGTSCYVLTSAIKSEDIPALYTYAMEKVADLLPEEVSQGAPLPSADDLSTITSLLTGIVMNMEIDIDAETFKPMRMYLDMDGTDWTMIEAIFANTFGLKNEDGKLMSINFDVKSLYMEGIYDYSTEAVVTVPDEVKAAAKEIDPAAIEDLAGSLGAAAGMAEEDATEAF